MSKTKDPNVSHQLNRARKLKEQGFKQISMVLSPAEYKVLEEFKAKKHLSSNKAVLWYGIIND